MQMIERNRRLVKDRPARQRGQSPGAWAAALRERLVPAELHHHELMKYLCRSSAAQAQSECYSGPITLSQFERFQWARDKLKEGGFFLLMPTGNWAARSLRAVTAAPPRSSWSRSLRERGFRNYATFSCIKPKRAVGSSPMTNLSIEPARRPGRGEEKRSRDVECNLSGEPEFFCLNRP